MSECTGSEAVRVPRWKSSPCLKRIQKIYNHEYHSMDELIHYFRSFQALMLPNNQLGMRAFYQNQLYYLDRMRDTILDMIEATEHCLRELEDI